MVLDFVVAKFMKPGSSSVKLSSSALLHDRATNAWAVGTSVDDVPTLSTLGRVVRTVCSAADALPLGMVRTC
jgi:hypothetical protein